MRAFLSSTFEDLKGHRAYVIRVLRKAGFSIDPMEDWAAALDEPKEFSQDRVRGCDLFILLVGLRRGHVPKGQTWSITQLEYQSAIEQNIDALVFMLREQAFWPRKFDDLDGDPALRDWRDELKEQKGIGFFDHEPKSIEFEASLNRWWHDKYRNLTEEIDGFGRLLEGLSLVRERHAYQTVNSINSLIESIQALATDRRFGRP